ncbi:MAG: sulfatase-like hydrolase/transferase [Acidobacteriota bacterium]|nr:sulfatase-like hydrolase/transferase [Acidobacteriota bacterium]
MLLITCEDIGPQIGAYGDKYANTPNLDRLASRGIIYKTAWSNAPVCAPARTTIISGLYPPSTGAEHMRSMTRLPSSMKMFPCYLRDAGYYASNNAKEDYNLEHTGQVWDDSSNKGHWRNRKSGQPFFSVFNLLITHESQIRTRPHKWVHDPAKAPLPAYHPDTPEVRQDWAQYYDNITTMDGQAGQLLRQLEQDGLADDTIVFFYGDHGSGMPRSKRWPYNSGLQVPLIVYIPEKYKHLALKDYKPGGTSERLVSFVDLAPTLCSLIGVKPPEQFQGYAFLGEFPATEQPYIYGFRGRMDERYDLVRSVRDKRYIYIRNYMPHRIYGQYIAYMFETPTTRVWRDLYDRGKLKPPRTYFWETKPSEELYDLEQDRDEVHNLAKSAAHQEILARMRQAQQNLALQIRDVGFLPENEIHSRAKGSSPYEAGHDPARYPFERVLHTADLASSMKPDASGELATALRDPDSAVRYWGAVGIVIRGTAAVQAASSPLRTALGDKAPAVRIAAAEALGRYGSDEDVAKALSVLMELAPPDKNGIYVSLLALNALDALGPKAMPVKDAIRALPREDPNAPGRMAAYAGNLIGKMLADLDKPKG